MMMDPCLALRQQLKVSIRARLRTENRAAGFKDNADNYGHFFGPSETIIADIVREKIKSWSESPKSAPKKLGGGEKLFGEETKTVKTIMDKIEKEKKLQWLRDTRDYSFLSSGCDEIINPGPIKKAETISRPHKISRPKKEEEYSRNIISKKPLEKTKVRKIQDGKVQWLRDTRDYSFLSSGSEIPGPVIIKAENNSRAIKKESETGMKNNSRPGKKEIQGSRDLKKRKVEGRQKEENNDDAIGMIRGLFGYDPTKYGDDDDIDDRRMEANFHDIEKEERRSAKIARKEDAEELRKLQVSSSKKRI